MKPETSVDDEPETLGGIFDELLDSMNETLAWAKGERELRTFTRSTDDAFYSSLGATVEQETGVDGKLASTIALTADVATVFDNATAVNTALRLVIQMADDAPVTQRATE